MIKRGLHYGLVLSLLCAVVACDSDDTTDSDLVNIKFTVVRDNISPREIAEFQLTASAEGRTITQSRVDFTDDGTWDEWRDNSGSDVAELFRYHFDTAGEHLVTVQVLEDNDVLGSAEATVTVNDFGIILEVTDSDNPDVTTTPIPPCAVFINGWTAEFHNTSTDPQADPSTHFVRMHIVLMDYEWHDGVTTTPSFSHTIGGYVPLDGTHSVTFSPLDPSEFTAVAGKTATVYMTFVGFIGDLTEIRVSAEADLHVEECP